MNSLSEFFHRKGGSATAEKLAAAHTASITPSTGPTDDDHPAETWAEMGSRIGGDNEVLRNLMIDTSRHVTALDGLKDAFGKLVDPINNTLLALEQEKSDNVGLRRTLAEVRSSYEALRSEFNELGRRSAASKTEIDRLRHELEIVRQLARGGETTNMELSDELVAVRGRLAEVERQLSLEANNAQILTEEKLALAAHGTSADKRIVELEDDLAVSRERIVLLENEKCSLQNSFDQRVNENSKLIHRINETDNTLREARTRLEQMETRCAASETERNKLTAAFDEANERGQSESDTLNMRLAGMQSRTTAAEKLLGEMRQSLTTRTEENRASERKLVEVTIAKNAIEKKLEQVLASLQGQERQIRDLDGSRATLIERTSALAKTVKSRELALARAEDRIQALTHQINQMVTDAEANRVKIEKRVEELSSALEREKMERAVADGALEATRKNYAELQRELASRRSQRLTATKREFLAARERRGGTR